MTDIPNPASLIRALPRTARVNTAIVGGYDLISWLTKGRKSNPPAGAGGLLWQDLCVSASLLLHY
jgi:hypothetical protein